MTAAALYVDVDRGPYASMPDVDAWGVERDAKRWPGGSPVVAHPPCGPWGSMRGLCKYQDPECGPIAVDQVRQWGGVLEHPAYSSLWEHCNLPRPLAPEGQLPLLAGRAWTLMVDQCRWGHPCRKRTWLLMVGIDPADLPPIPDWQKPTHFIGGTKASRAKAKARGMRQLGGGSTPYANKATPPAFADWLVECARRVRI